MNFRTLIDLPTYPFQLNYSDYSLWMGSCFANNLGKIMQQARFHTVVNPFGTSYNPISLAQNIQLLIMGKLLQANQLFAYGGQWHSFNFHSSYSATSCEIALNKMNDSIQQGHKHLLKSKYLFITLGTSYVFENINNKQVVSNCHKLPGSTFSRKLLSINQSVQVLTDCFVELWKFNPDIKVVFTLSPIRHLRDGLHSNQLSKSQLLLCIDTIIQQFPDQVFYFPAYEILLDDLRDYRYYADDMCHPSPLAIAYIWDQFKTACILPDIYPLMRTISKLNQAEEHRPSDLNSKEYIQFKARIDQQKNDLKKIYPDINWT